MTRDLKKDAAASVAVALVAIPLCLGIAHASGAPLMSGLIAGVVGGVVVGGLSRSQLSVTGPAAGLTTIVAASILRLSSFEAFLTAVVIAGVLQILFGKLRAGGLSRLFPSPVIKGMLAAIGLILICKQFPHLVGYDVEEQGAEHFSDNPADINPAFQNTTDYDVNTFSLMGHAFSHIDPGAVLIGLTCLAILYIWDARFQKRLPTLPGSLVAVTVGVLFNMALGILAPAWRIAADHLVQIPALTGGFLRFPDWSALNNPQVYITAITLALVASVETLLTVEALDRLDPHHRVSPPNRELLAQGAGNIVCGLLGGIPVTSVVVRGTVNLQAGATSKASTVLHGLFILLSLLLFRNGLNQIPLAALAAVLIHVGAKMAHPSIFRRMAARGNAQLIPFVATIIAILFSDLLIGIGVGTMVAAAFILRNLHLSRGFHAQQNGLITRITFHQDVTFFHKVQLSSLLDKLPMGSLVEIDGANARVIDQDVIDVIEVFCSRAPQRNIQVMVGGIELLSSFSKDQIQNMQDEYNNLLANNARWVEDMGKNDPQYFERMSHGQKPSFLYIGCSDSRVPAEVVTGAEPGKLFVHRNIANLVSSHDTNLMSVLQYSVEHLNVPHIIICGHYGCGGVRAALSEDSFGQIDNWVQPIKKVVQEHQAELDAIPDPEQRERRVIELHVLEQVRNVLRTNVVQYSVQKLGIPKVHGWVYDLKTGKIIDLKSQIGLEDVNAVYHFDFGLNGSPSQEKTTAVKV